MDCFLGRYVVVDAVFFNYFLFLGHSSFNFFPLFYRLKNTQLRNLQVTLSENKGLPAYFATDATPPAYLDMTP